MKENKYDTLLRISLVVLVVSLLALFISSYNFYFKNKKLQQQAVINSGSFYNNGIETLRDSLQRLYAATVQNMDENFKTSWGSADTLAEGLDIKLAEFNKLRNDISIILKDKSTGANLGTAMLKIQELQIKVNALRNKNTDVETENKRLQALLLQLMEKEKNGNQINYSTDEKIKTAVRFAETKKSGIIIASEIRFFAVTINNNKETETSDAADAEKIIGSFSVKNAIAKSNTELMVVVLQPDGKLVKNSVWESGVFETKEGKKVYSRKIMFDPTTNEKQFNFTLNPDKFIKGEYSMQIWCNGNMIGKVSRVLS